MKQWLFVLVGAVLIGWLHAHTDEIPLVLGFVLVLSALLGAVFPRRPWLTGFLTGSPVFLVETLVHFAVIRAPYPPSAGLPWAALTAFVPAMGGAFLGSVVRNLYNEANPGG